jgi:hypothetical protein
VKMRTLRLVRETRFVFTCHCKVHCTEDLQSQNVPSYWRRHLGPLNVPRRAGDLEALTRPSEEGRRIYCIVCFSMGIYTNT